MKLSFKWIAVLAFLLWEAWWAYVFISAPVPDEKMDSIFALLMGVFLPVVIGAPVVVALCIRRIMPWKD